MTTSPFLPLPPQVGITTVETQGDILTVFLLATGLTGECPLCHSLSDRIHSHYQRVLADVPCGGQQVRLCLTLRRFRCPCTTCPQRIFAERFPDLVTPWARMTNRLIHALQSLGLATTGAGGARLGQQLGMPTSATTLVRHLLALPPISPGLVTELGVDDFSFRRGRTFGTILVNLATHPILDILPDRSPERTAAWMRQHPEIRIVSRDRGADYAAAVQQGAPHAIQILDRFHVVQNLAQAVEQVIAHHCTRLQVFQPRTISAEKDEVIPPLRGLAEAARQQRIEQRRTRYRQMLTLLQQGWTQRQIAHEFGISTRTIQRYVGAGTFPERKRRSGRSVDLTPHLDWIHAWWHQGVREKTILRQQLCQRGYTGTRATVYAYLAALRQSPSGGMAKTRRYIRTQREQQRGYS